MTTLSRISSAVDAHGMAPLLLALGGSKGRGGRWFCPICQSAGREKHRSPDLHEGPHWVKCHKCGASGGWYSFLKAAGIAMPIEYAEVVYFGGASSVRPTLRHVAAPKPRPPRKLSTYLALAEEMARDGWNHADTYAYGPSAVVMRFEKDGIKTFRQLTWDGHEWCMAGPRPPVPLYRGKNPTAEPMDGVWFAVEGEKCVDAVRRCGFRAACSIGGAKNAEAGDWQPLHGGRVVVLPDNDEAGRGYAEAVRKVLDGKAEVVVFSLPVGDGEDVADLCERAGTGRAREYLDRLQRTLYTKETASV